VTGAQSSPPFRTLPARDWWSYRERTETDVYLGGGLLLVIVIILLILFVL
jgi:hypothetical protein